jgi:hypothetical protein
LTSRLSATVSTRITLSADSTRALSSSVNVSPASAGASADGLSVNMTTRAVTAAVTDMNATESASRYFSGIIIYPLF